MKKDIHTLNSKGQYRGYCMYYVSDRLIRCNYKFDLVHGYRENHLIKRTIFYIK